MEESKDNPKPQSRTAIRYLLPLGLAGLLIGLIGIWLKYEPKIDSVSGVTRQIYDIALSRGDEDGAPRGGAVGPWWISAEGTDDLSGDLTGFSLTSGDLHLGAERATVWVDPVHDAFSLQLHDVVVLAAPTQDALDPSFLVDLKEYVLGPAPWERNIVADDELPSQRMQLTGAE